MHAIVLAGGFGTRLQSLVSDVPKPMAPIGSKPFLSFLIDYLKQQGVTRVTLSVHHLREQIEAYFKTEYNGVAITYAVEEKPLGTGGAIVNALRYHDSSEPVFVINGDTFLQLDYRKMWQQHQINSPIITMALRKIADCGRYGAVEVTDNVVTAFLERGESKPGLINAGVYLINPSLTTLIDLPEQFSFEKDFLYVHLRKISPRSFITDNYFIDIGIPDDYMQAIQQLPKFIV